MANVPDHPPTICSTSLTPSTGGSTSITSTSTSFNIIEQVCDNCGHGQSNHYDGSCHKIISCCCHGSKCPCDSYKPRNYYPNYPYPVYPTNDPVWVYPKFEVTC